MPIAAVQTASGYDVAWEVTGRQQVHGLEHRQQRQLHGTSDRRVCREIATALESLEPVFQQDLNGDGVIGVTTTVIQTDGSTSLTEVGNQFYLLCAAADLARHCNITARTLRPVSLAAGRRSARCRRQAGMTLPGRMTGTDQYTVWSTDSNGNYIANFDRRCRVGNQLLRWNRSSPFSTKT